MADAQRIVIRLYDSDQGVRLELANEDHPELRSVYSQRRSNAALKLAPDEALAQLLATLDDLGFQRWAKPQAAPSPTDQRLAPDAAAIEGWIEVRLDAQVSSFVLPAGRADPAALAAFAEMQVSIANTYAGIGGLQFIDNPLGARIFPRDS
ncbi:MAG: hypothetical protein ACT4PU_07585 [Planctomycetota bacterium]